MCIRWVNASSPFFTVYNGVKAKQGGINYIAYFLCLHRWVKCHNK